ncbi:uncharacterized protein N7484_004009 [Penicillium longicatenatum]|uniref:uncharacterized protein n=1 Tax=Penicillium longicatenatum TaxID=1561947 RepID=UPI002546F543|nr:uncharacterized protein N7484_004009 [Penicillium longicatenatum]KAJ5650286.1 hypothetical protein N7484_004009 [Penicillium longicatenatum]
MAPSLQELIAFLLNEVALCGNQGATLLDVLNSIDIFYRNSSQNGSGRRQLVDRHFQRKVWSWLTRNPEVSVGLGNKWNHLSLDELEELDQSARNSQNEVEEEIENERETSAPSAASKVHIFVSKERTWYAVAGHEPDDNKLPTSEFLLLSIIATRKSEGIPQTELVKISGQDKRSVPKRTDALAAKGYIEKRAVQVKAARTSLLTLRRFMNAPTAQPSNENTTEARPMIDFDVFTKQLFDALRENDGTITRNDLKKVLGFEDLWRSRILSRTVRKYEKIGVLKRVRVKSQYNLMHPCIMLMREPTPTDVEKFFEFSRHGFKRNDDHPADMDEDEDLEADAQNVTDSGEGDLQIKNDRVVASGRIVPIWTPDRALSNQLFDIIDKAGTSGITNDLINRTCFGVYYKRPSENMVHRLTDCWQISQPPHLRHLALVRDSDVHKTIIHYVHYSARNFSTKVIEGTAFWEAVEFPDRKHKSLKTELPRVDAPAELDQYGLPHNNIPVGMMKNGNISLFEGLASCKPADYSLTRKDPMGVIQADGSYRIQPGSSVPLQGLQQSGFKMNNGKGRPRGRPSKSKSKKIKRESSVVSVPDESDIVMEDNSPVPLHWDKRQSQKKREKYQGMSKKQRFEAMGWDETWTEYNALVMEKPTPGVYVTPHGKRRPAGKKQGRPKTSRIAVFKSSRLSTLPWFCKDDNDSDYGDTGAGVEMTPAAAATPRMETEELVSRQLSETIEDTPTRPRKGKRAHPITDVSDSPAPSESATMAKGPKGRPRKQARIRGPQDDSQTNQIVSKSQEPASGQTGIDLTLADANVTEQSNGEAAGSRTQRDTRSLERNATENIMGPPPSRLATPKPQTSTVHLIPMNGTPVDKRSESLKVHGSAHRGGSIPFLRRRIVMDIVEKAGGAYPGGGELWYPFTTAWMKMNHKEKPDMRTVKTTIKYLVDAGQLQQLTFSGRDGRGTMVTKTILRKPELSPDDPLVKDLQAQLLARDRNPKNSFSPHIETNHKISRNGGSFGPNGVGGQKFRRFSLPTVSDATVHLHSKPASVLIQEKKRRVAVHRKLMRRMLHEDSETDSEDDLELYEDNFDPRFQVHRLMRFPPQLGQGSENNGTYLYRPMTGGDMVPTMSTFKIRQHPFGKTKRLPRIISSMEAMKMLMNPGQILHDSTHTFATGSIKRRWGGGKHATFADTRVSKHFNFADAVQELTGLARQSNNWIGPMGTSTTEARRFALKMDKILEWELENDGMADSKLDEPLFIVHTVDKGFVQGPINGPICFEMDQPVRSAKSRKARILTRGFYARRQRRRKHELSQANASSMDRDGKNGQGHFPSRRRTFKPLPEGVIRRYMVAITAVRTLAGGLEGKIVDWDLVPLAFPNSDPEFVRHHGKSILGRNRTEIHKMQRDFQERYLQAYEKKQVPPIDYNNLAGYNWPAVVEWASIELDFSTSEKAPTLPATREQFDSMFELREESVTTAEEAHVTTGSLTVANKKRLLGRIPFVVEQPRIVSPLPPRHDLQNLEIAKTWVRANTMTPTERYNAAAATETLAPIGESLLASATQSLMTDRIICNANRGRVTPGRNYMPHDVFLQTMERRRAIDGDQLARAAEFKLTVLDPALKAKGSFKINYHAGDGDALAVDELFAHGQVELIPLNLPREKFGLIDGAYLTRQMDKSRLRFEMEVRALPEYVYGNPIHDVVHGTPPPLPPASRHLPLWFDIHGCLMQDWWHKSIAAVMGCLIIRPGVSIESIAIMIKPGLMKWEIELLLEEWLLKVGLVEKSGTPTRPCWSVKEWWWMALGG